MVNKQKILIVDDDANIAELISLYLTKECFDTMIVEDGESALRAVDTFAPNLILLDLMLPGIDGYQVCREVRSSSSVPIIMLSAKGEIFDKVLGLEHGKALRLQGACRKSQGGAAPLQASCCRSNKARCGMCRISRSDHQ